MRRLQRPMKDIILDIRAHYYDSGLTQHEYAADSGVSQATISRMLCDDIARKRLSSGLRKLCKYACVQIYAQEKKDIRLQTELIGILESVWDGSDSHAKILGNILKELGNLCTHK